DGNPHPPPRRPLEPQPAQPRQGRRALRPRRRPGARRTRAARAGRCRARARRRLGGFGVIPPGRVTRPGYARHMVQLGQHAPPVHTIAHISDTHLLGGGRALYGQVDTDAHVAQAFAQLERSGMRPEAIVVTGDLADLGEPEAYERLTTLVEPAAERMGARLVWVMGNHDEREPFSSILLGDEPSTAPQDRVHELNGLRIIALDTSVPGYH